MKNSFAVLPSVDISRSKFLRNSQYKGSGKVGEIQVLYCDEVLPGDTRKLDFGALLRLNNPVAPILDNLYMDFYAFFVPNRLTWEHWKEFMGENSSSAGIYAGAEYKIPQINLFATGVSVGSIGDQLGLPICIQDVSKTLKVSVLPIRGLRLIYNRWFRDQNIIAPLTVSKSDSVSTTYDSYNANPFKAAKLSDYFTRSLPYAQKGSPIQIPLGGSAPVVVEMIHPYASGINPGTTIATNDVLSDVGDVVGFDLTSGSSYTSSVFADLSQATAATINQLRFAFQYQKMLEKDALYGTRYWEILKAHFGIEAPDASLQDPEYLGHYKMNINIDQVVQTTGIDQDTPSQNELGQVAAVSVTGGKGSLFTKSFTEHGYIFVLGVMRHDQTYGQGVERHWSRSVRTDFYFPVFANLGAQEVKNKEIFAQGDTTTNDDKVFGFQEAWAEYRYKPSKATGLLRPNVSGSLGWWTLANNFASLPTLGQTFIEQGRDAVSRVLSTGATGPDFIIDMAFKDIAVRPMPLYSVPGLIDHH